MLCVYGFLWLLLRFFVGVLYWFGLCFVVDVGGRWCGLVWVDVWWFVVFVVVCFGLLFVFWWIVFYWVFIDSVWLVVGYGGFVCVCGWWLGWWLIGRGRFGGC